MRTWTESAAAAIVLVVVTLFAFWRIGYNMGADSVEPAQVAPEAVTCTLYEDGSVGCNASLVGPEDYHVGGACLIPEWGCED